MIPPQMRSPASRALLFSIAFLAASGPVLAEAPTSWHKTVLENLRDEEYKFSELDDGAWVAPNRAHRVRTHVPIQISRLHIPTWPANKLHIPRRPGQ